MKTGEEHFQDYLDSLEKKHMQDLGLSLMASAYSDYAPAQAILGRYHLLGEVFPRDLPNALKWLEKAVAQDYAPAMTTLAAMYMFGDGGEGQRQEGGGAAHPGHRAGGRGSPVRAGRVQREGHRRQQGPAGRQSLVREGRPEGHYRERPYGVRQRNRKGIPLAGTLPKNT